MRYAAVIEQGETGFGAYAPDPIPGPTSSIEFVEVGA
jgi:hypothetical protein